MVEGFFHEHRPLDRRHDQKRAGMDWAQAGGAVAAIDADDGAGYWNCFFAEPDEGGALHSGDHWRGVDLYLDETAETPEGSHGRGCRGGGDSGFDARRCDGRSVTG